MTTAKKINDVLRSTRSEKHEDKKRKAQESEVLKLVRDALKRSKAQRDQAKD